MLASGKTVGKMDQGLNQCDSDSCSGQAPLGQDTRQESRRCWLAAKKGSGIPRRGLQVTAGNSCLKNIVGCLSLNVKVKGKTRATRCGMRMPGQLYSLLAVWPFIWVQERRKNCHISSAIWLWWFPHTHVGHIVQPLLADPWLSEGFGTHSPSRLPAALLQGLCAQAWLTKPFFPQRCLGRIERSNWLIAFISSLLLTSCLLLLPPYTKPFAATWSFKILFIQEEPRVKTAVCLRKQKKQWLQWAQALWMAWFPTNPQLPTLRWLPTTLPCDAMIANY